MYLVALAWMYVVLMMSVAEAMAPNGTVLGAFFTFLLYGALPLSIVMYVLGAPARRQARRRAEATAREGVPESPQPDGRGVAPRDAVAPEREEP